MKTAAWCAAEAFPSNAEWTTCPWLGRLGGQSRSFDLSSRESHVDPTSSAARRADNAYLYSATDTLKGSSGAPVFNDQWYVVALHRRGVPAIG